MKTKKKKLGIHETIHKVDRHFLAVAKLIDALSLPELWQ